MSRHLLLSSALSAAALVALSPLDVLGSELTKQQCVAFNERGQTLREQHHLRAAREQFAACVSASCPSAVRDDCADAVQKLDKALPTIVFSVRGRDGSSLKSVGVRVDGEPLKELVDGSALTVDPGDHEVTIEVSGYFAKNVSVHTQEGAGQQKLTISVEPITETKSPATPAPTSVPPPSQSVEAPAPSPRRVLTYSLAGTGLVAIGLGAAFGISAKIKYDDATGPTRCPSGPPACDSLGVDGVHSAGSAATASTVLFLVGGLLAGAAAALWFTEPSGDSSRAVRAGTWQW